jgi:arsenate reductase
MDAPLIVYHNAQCSKSRGALEILTERRVPFTVRYYVDEPLTATELEALLKKLSLPASAIVRRHEALVQELTAGREPNEEGWIQFLATHPFLIERPIVENTNKAIVARPPERVLELL